jgi:hypothetical protein
MTPFQKDVLAAIADGCDHYWDIRQRLWNNGRRTIHEARLLCALGALRAEGKIVTSMAGRNTLAPQPANAEAPL